jgi:hypothetical protein
MALDAVLKTEILAGTRVMAIVGTGPNAWMADDDVRLAKSRVNDVSVPGPSMTVTEPSGFTESPA